MPENTSNETPTERTPCYECDSTHGPAILTVRGWRCLKHLPKFGDRRSVYGRGQ